ncbi:ECF transporter S component [Streptococcus dentapri]|uniref:ECF transporter S component n=1 Tax=Streptococcus dentapri TaxID=573564 RepID=A0ABV8D196_9STRE
MQKIDTKDLTLLALMTGLSLVLGLIHVPTPTGFLTLLDTGIFFTSFLLGSRRGAIVGGLSAFLLDLYLGYPQYMVFSLLAHGAQGYFAGWQGKGRLLGLLLASVIMIVVYILAAFALGYGWGGAIAGIWGNFCQNTLGLVLGFSFYRAFTRVFPRR